MPSLEAEAGPGRDALLVGACSSRLVCLVFFFLLFSSPRAPSLLKA